MEKSKVRLRNDKNGTTVLIGKDNVQESILYIQTHQIKNVEITYRYGETHIDFLSECPYIEVLILEGPSVKNFDGAYHLKALKALEIKEVSPSLTIDFSQLTSLEELYGKLPLKTLSIGSLINLKRMMIRDFKAKGENLEEFTDLEALVHLELMNSNIISLEGIQRLKKLSRLGLFRMKVLTNIEAIQQLSENLTKLQIEFVKNIQDFSPIGKVQSLQYLSLNACGAIPSIRFTEQLPYLKTLIFADSTVMDGDVSPCIGLEYVYFTENKHYSHRLKEVASVHDCPSHKESLIQEGTEAMPKNTNCEEQLLLTQEWRMRMEDGDDEFTEENIAATETVLRDYMGGLTHIQEPSQKEIIKIVKETVLRLNALNEEYDFFIETQEREELYEFIMENAQRAGLETEEDITEEWREW